MIIPKLRISSDFTIMLTLKSEKDAHGKMSDRESQIHEILNSHCDAMKIQLQELIGSVPDKEVKGVSIEETNKQTT
jgi:hypothetical protein